MNPAVMLAPVIVLLFAAAIEAARPRPYAGIDAMRLTFVVFCLAFVVAPLQIAGTDLRWVRGGPWEWVLNHLPTSGGFVSAELLALLGWITLVVTYIAVRRQRVLVAPIDALVDQPGRTLAVALALLALGSAALVIYTMSIGGWRVLIFDALAFRSGEPPVVTQFAFLKNVAPLSVAAAFLLYGLRRDTAGRTRRMVNWLLPLALLASVVILFHQAGRLSMLAFLITFPLASAVQRGRLRLGVIAGMAVLFAVLILFGNQLFEPHGAGVLLGDRWQALRDESGGAIQLVGIEFSFPFLNLVHAIQGVPGALPFRWFADVPLGFIYLVPQRLLGVVHAPTMTALNSEQLGARAAIPVDLVSFGFMSAWIPGVLIVCSGLGAALAWLDQQARTRTFTATVLRVALMLFLAFRIMYADPTLVLQGGFYLIVLFAVLALARRAVDSHVGEPAA